MPFEPRQAGQSMLPFRFVEQRKGRQKAIALKLLNLLWGKSCHLSVLVTLPTAFPIAAGFRKFLSVFDCHAAIHWQGDTVDISGCR